MPNFFASLFDPNSFSEDQAKKRAIAIGGQEAMLPAEAQQAAQQYQDVAISSQEGQMAALGTLGTAGTYELPGEAGLSKANKATAAQVTAAINGALKSESLSPQVATAYLNSIKSGADPNEVMSALQTQIPGILNPQGYAAALAKDPTFQIESALTAEAQQGLAHTGPLWSMTQPILGSIYEGAAKEYSDSVNAINQMAAQGGTARNTAIAEAERMQAMETANRDRSQQLWQANLQLQQYVDNFAQNQVKANEAYVQDLPFQSAYDNHMQALSNMIVNGVVPNSSKALEAAASLNTGGVDKNGNVVPAATATGQSNILGNLVLGGITALTGGLVGGGLNNTTNNAGTAIGSSTTAPGGRTGAPNPTMIGNNSGGFNMGNWIINKGASLLTGGGGGGTNVADTGSSGVSALFGDNSIV